MGKRKKLILGGVLFIGVILIAGFTLLSVLKPSVKVGYVGNSVGNTINASFKYFDGVESRKVKFNEGDIVTIKYAIGLEEGSLSLVVFDEKGNEIINRSDSEGEVSFQVSETQKYKISLVAAKAKGDFSVKWGI
ncbi:hypothetical protein [Acetivibrio straminisolvens]|jgi:hypothetical protein|uniref:GOLD domain-containing protein n=1 Tax=Acetivibrio straminisolvens JCM 21531 TaxID=1294263 RepID=W4V1E0_9FIRM|nr:hypothetical protein [Acetivibrio straminisolvens]GAE87036.1 hypothetical protein JCM21531_378 [Acetivibrio straminisolvens JCM 21531]